MLQRKRLSLDHLEDGALDGKEIDTGYGMEMGGVPVTSVSSWNA